jgi:SPP1 gp7 family putative phage head morphogenesis protein
VSYYKANRVIQSEMAHIQTQAAQQRYKDMGVTEMEFWADPDERTCDVCGKLHKKRYSIHDIAPIPAHPNCRCCLVPVVV